jgi:hypothetical protein
MKHLILVLALLLAACGGGGDEEDVTEPTEKATDPAPPASAPHRG